jgi:hypothetical protein
VSIVYLPGMEDSADESKSCRETETKKSSRREREFNIALMDIVDGRGSTIDRLAIVTGLTHDSIKARVKRARYDYKDLPDATPELEADEKRYYARLWGNSKNPEVQDFLMRTNACSRRRPDWRSNKDRVA